MHGRPDGLQFGDMFVWSIVESRSLFQKGWTIHIDYTLYILHCTFYIIPVVPHKAGGGSFKNRKPIGEVGCCEPRMAERSHSWTKKGLRSPLFLSLSILFSLFLYLSLIIYLTTYLMIYRSTYLSVCLSIYLSISLSTYLPIYLSIDLSIHRSIDLSIYRSIDLSIGRSIDLSIHPSIHPSIHLSIYLSNLSNLSNLSI